MKFCPDCGKILAPIKASEKKENNSVNYQCPKCGYTNIYSDHTQEKNILESNKSEEKIVVIGRDDQKLRTNPTQKAKCPKCSNNLAEIWQVQTRSGDEGATQFFRCTKCNFTWRLYT